MSDAEFSSHLFRSSIGLHQIFFWRDLVNFGAFRAGGWGWKDAHEEEVARTMCRRDGVKMLLEAPLEIHSPDASRFYCDPADGFAIRARLLEVAKVPTEPTTSAEHSRLVAIRDFAKTMQDEWKRERLALKIDKLVVEVNADKGEAAKRLKRRRADIAQVLDALLSVAVEPSVVQVKPLVAYIDDDDNGDSFELPAELPTPKRTKKN